MVSNKYVASINLRGSNYSVRYNKNSAQTFRGIEEMLNHQRLKTKTGSSNAVFTRI